jgi:hypothetical protein
MRIYLVFIWLLCTLLPVSANPDVTTLINWDRKPADVSADLAKSGIEVELKMFHKTGVPYLQGPISTLGNTWDGTVYFNEQDLPNQLLLQLDDQTASGANRVQKLAVAEFGKEYKTRTTEGSTRDDHFFVWQLKGLEIQLNTATYKNRPTKTLWLQITPLK